jgi:hypothetical protein
MRRPWFGSWLITLFALGMIASAAHAQTDDERYTVMKPEPGERHRLPRIDLLPTYKPPRGTRLHVKPVRPAEPPQPQAQVPPPLYVPQTGRVLPNLPSQGSGPGGRETYQDRAVRCAHQAGVYGAQAGNSSAYIGSCINQ